MLFKKYSFLKWDLSYKERASKISLKIPNFLQEMRHQTSWESCDVIGSSKVSHDHNNQWRRSFLRTFGDIPYCHGNKMEVTDSFHVAFNRQNNRNLGKDVNGSGKQFPFK